MCMSGSIPFFMALYQAFKVLGYAGQNKVFSPEAVKALRTIKYCAIAIIGFVVVEEIFIMLMNNGDSDNPGAPIFMGILITFRFDRRSPPRRRCLNGFCRMPWI